MGSLLLRRRIFRRWSSIHCNKNKYETNMKQRTICWFSCGAASAVAAKLVVDSGVENVSVIYCDTSKNEHPDNARFFDDVQKWLGVEITRISNPNFDSVEDVFNKKSYMCGIAGAPCTVELKKKPRFAFQRADDVHVFGYTADEHKRITRFENDNPELLLYWPLLSHNLNKESVLRIVAEAGIELPMMYKLGFKNNNCLGCVKATSPSYWNSIREHFPEVFQSRAEQSRKIGARLTRVKGTRIFLDELEASCPEVIDEDLSCGPQCRGVSDDLTELTSIATI